MPNGKVGDHPFTDIVHHGRDLYSARAAGLVREIARLADDGTRRFLQDLLMRDFNEYDSPDIARLEKVLLELRDRLVQEAKERGYEVD